MKKSLLALAALGLFAGAASAQSSVTVFGIVDLSVATVKNGSNSITGMFSNQLNSNRLGFRGTEDLGGGLKASFWLEAGMDNDIGNAGGGNSINTYGTPVAGINTTQPGGTSTLFNRRSTVALSGNFGEIRFGRDYTPTFLPTAVFDVFGANGFGQSLNTINIGGFGGTQGGSSGAGTFVRANNAVSYFLPGGLGGFYGHFMMAAGEGFNGQKYQGLRVGYAAGPFDVSYAQSSTQTPTFDFDVWNVGASWDFKFMKLLGLYNEISHGDRKNTMYEISASVPFGQGEFKASYSNANASGCSASKVCIDKDDADSFALEYIYNLSKRTAIYGQYGQVSNKGKANYTVLTGGGPAPTAAEGAAGGWKSTGYGIGVRHAF